MLTMMSNLHSTCCIPQLKKKSQWIFLFAVCLCACAGSGVPGSDQNAHPRFICTPLPADTDPGCFPTTGGPNGPINGHPSGPNGNSNSRFGMSEEAKATILHLRESLVQQKETILDQRETIRDLTAKVNLCEGFNRGPGNHNEHLHGTTAHLAHHTYLPTPEKAHPGWTGPDSHHGNHGLELGHHGEGVEGYQRGKGALSEKLATGEMTPSASSTPEQMSRMLQSLKERLENLQIRNTSTTYSSSLKDLLQRKISALEQQIQRHSAPLTDHSNDKDDDGGDSHHGYDYEESHGEDHYDNEDPGDHDDSRDESQHNNHRDDDHPDDDHDESPPYQNRDDNGHQDNNHYDNEVSKHGFETFPYHSQGHRGASNDVHSKLDAVLSHLQHRLADTGSRKKSKAKEAFQIGFPIRTNYMYGRVKRTLLNEIFSFTLCLWIKAGVGPGLGTPFSYSVPGQANELVLIEWGNNPMELLIDDRAVTLPVSLSDGKWHHICVTWSTRDGLWEAYQDGVKRGSGENLSPWHPIKPGGVFILGQEQDTLGGRFDATQAFVGEISDVQMWSRVLTTPDVYSLASCGAHITGDIIAWSESIMELHGGVTEYPFDPCH